MSENVPKTLYHYCSLQTFYNIINGKSIWLSDITQSNDSLELQYTKDIFESKVKENFISFLENNEREFLQLDSKKGEYILNLLQKGFSSSAKCWGFCLSEKRNLLSQWRGYSDDGRGVSIGFNTKELYRILSELESDENGDFIFLDKVEYSKEKIQQEIDMEISRRDTFSNLVDFETRLGELSAFFELKAPFYKSSFFEEECEWRIVLNKTKFSYKLDKGELLSTNSATLKGMDYIVTDNKLISHYEIIIKNLKDIISEINLGPKCSSSVEEVKQFLINKGILNDINDDAIKINPQEGSYR